MSDFKTINRIFVPKIKILKFLNIKKKNVNKGLRKFIVSVAVSEFIFVSLFDMN